MKKTRVNGQLGSSFKDPCGFLFKKDGVLFRQVNRVYKKHYDYLIKSGLYKHLVGKDLLISHSEVRWRSKSKNAYKIIKPELVEFISYSYEWCFSQLKDAALTTLEIQKVALSYGMTLKDASAYNVQFVSGKPIFIDTLSFEIYEEGEPWVAYRQFCQHFLAPLALMSLKDFRLNNLLKNYIDGIPLDLAGSLLPLKSFLNLSLLTHIHFHARSQKYYSKRKINLTSRKISKEALLALINGLEATIQNLHLKIGGSVWDKYYQSTNYTNTAFRHKKVLVEKCIKKIKPKTVWDLGANTGVFSRIASSFGAMVISFDNDFLSVESNYLKVKEGRETNVLPLFIDLTNPSPSLGWGNEERNSLVERGPADCVLALALIHHLIIGNNVSFEKMAEFFSRIGKWLIIEYVPKDDSNVKRLLMNRKDVFGFYTQCDFEKEFKKHFIIVGKFKVRNSSRTIYLMKKK